MTRKFIKQDEKIIAKCKASLTGIEAERIHNGDEMGFYANVKMHKVFSLYNEGCQFTLQTGELAPFWVSAFILLSTPGKLHMQLGEH